VRDIVELFRLVKREKEPHRQILAFSHKTVRIYGHYPVIDGNKTTLYRHPIRKFDFTELDGKEKWTSYKFTTQLQFTSSSVKDVQVGSRLARGSSCLLCMSRGRLFEPGTTFFLGC
jgi:hypothetical protein